MFFVIRPNKKVPVFRATRLYPNFFRETLDLLSGFLGKNIILCVLKGSKGSRPFKMHKIYRGFFSRKKRRKIVCLQYLQFSDPTRLFCYWPSIKTWTDVHVGHIYQPLFCSFFFLSNEKFCRRFLSCYWSQCFPILH